MADNTSLLVHEEESYSFTSTALELEDDKISSTSLEPNAPLVSLNSLPISSPTTAMLPDSPKTAAPPAHTVPTGSSPTVVVSTTSTKPTESPVILKPPSPTILPDSSSHPTSASPTSNATSITPSRMTTAISVEPPETPVVLSTVAVSSSSLTKLTEPVPSSTLAVSTPRPTSLVLPSTTAVSSTPGANGEVYVVVTVGEPSSPCQPSTVGTIPDPGPSRRTTWAPLPEKWSHTNFKLKNRNKFIATIVIVTSIVFIIIMTYVFSMTKS